MTRCNIRAAIQHLPVDSSQHHTSNRLVIPVFIVWKKCQTNQYEALNMTISILGLATWGLACEEETLKITCLYHLFHSLSLSHSCRLNLPIGVYLYMYISMHSIFRHTHMNSYRLGQFYPHASSKSEIRCPHNDVDMYIS